MSTKSSVTTDTVNELKNDDETFKAGNKVKAFYQNFTLYFMAILFISTTVSSIILLFAYQQSEQSKALINGEIATLQRQFQQQSYLIKMNDVIDEVKYTSDVRQLIPLHKKLLLQNKKLSLLQSQHDDNYQQWLLNNNKATELITGIESNYRSNEELKSKGLIQLDTLLDAIEIQLNSADTNLESITVLSLIKNNLIDVVSQLESLNLQTTLAEYEELQRQIDEMFVVDYGNMLASLREDNQGILEIIRDFIRFEDIVLKEGLLIQSQADIRVMENYYNQLTSQQQQLKSISINLSDNVQSRKKKFTNGLFKVDNEATQYHLSIKLWLSYVLGLISITLLLWLTRQRIKRSVQQNLDYIDDALTQSVSNLHKKDMAAVSRHLNHDITLYCVESLSLVAKIQQLNKHRVSEAQYLTLVAQNEKLEEQAIKEQAKQKQLKVALEQADINAKEKSKLVYEQNLGENLHLAAINQIVLLGCSAITTERDDKSNNERHLYRAYIQNCYLERQLRQESYHKYLLSSDSVLTLSDENLIPQIHSVLLNLVDEFSICQNQVLLEIDDNIKTAVNLDVDLFIEMLSAFIRLLLSQQMQQKLLLNLQLVDKNNGQQIISFKAKVQGTEKVETLPHRFESFNENCNEKTDYVTRLIRFLHGENISTTLIERGYQISFTMPFAIANTAQNQSYPSLVLPMHSQSIAHAVTQLTTQYLSMPIDVLVAVKSPESYQRLQQLLQGVGLQVCFVSSARMLEQKWHSGRFTVLMTEFSCTSLTRFTSNKEGMVQESIYLPRGVFTLGGTLALNTEEEPAHWSFGQLSADSSIDQLVTAMKPWIKEKKKAAPVNHYNGDIGSDIDNKIQQVTISNLPAKSFDFERYIEHQGSAELALYMIGEYTIENTLLVTRLEQAFDAGELDNAEIAIQALIVNGRILAADYLLYLCEHWQKLLRKKIMDNHQEIQVSLLKKTKQAVTAITLHADAVT
jgi:hypothetical protein